MCVNYTGHVVDTVNTSWYRYIYDNFFGFNCYRHFDVSTYLYFLNYITLHFQKKILSFQSNDLLGLGIFKCSVLFLIS